MMKRILFVLMSAISLAVTILFAGYVSHLIPSPAEFIATLIASAIMVFFTDRLIKYREWPVVVFALLLILFGVSSSLIAKRMIHAGTATVAANIRVADAGAHVKKDFLSFEDASIDFDKTGYHLVQFYGDHHYYAFPVIGDDWKDGDEVIVWTWVRTQKAKDADQLRRLIPVAADFGLRIRQKTIRKNVLLAVDEATTKYSLEVPQDIIILEWGEANSTEPFKSKLLINFLIYLSIITVCVLLQLVIKKEQKT